MIRDSGGIYWKHELRKVFIEFFLATWLDSRMMRVAAAIVMLWCALILGCSSSEDVDADIAYARKAYASGHYTEAERVYQGYLQRRPEGRRRWEAWGRLLDISRNVYSSPEKSVDLLESMYLEFSEDDDKAWDILTDLAKEHASARQWSKAVDAWQRSLNIPKLPEERIPGVHLELADIYRKQREFHLALDALRTCESKAQNRQVRGECLYELAQTYDLMQQPAEAIEVLEKLRGVEGLDAERHALATFLLADLKAAEGHTKEAVALLESIKDVYPNPLVIKTRLKQLR